MDNNDSVLNEKISSNNNEDDNSMNNDNGTVVIGEGVRLEGRIENAEDTHVSGTYNGSIKSENLNIENSGNIRGDISAQDIVISGKFDGNMKIENNISVNNTASVKGVFEYNTIQVSFGATIEGTLKHSGSVSSFTPANQNKLNDYNQQNSESNDFEDKKSEEEN